MVNIRYYKLIWYYVQTQITDIMDSDGKSIQSTATKEKLLNNINYFIN